MKIENTFNKDLFAQLLERAKGERSINRFAEETGVSAAHISRFLRSLIDSAPAPDTISKLSSKAYNDVSYKDLMAAAGHISLNRQNGSVGLDGLDDDEDENITMNNRRSFVPPRNASIDSQSPTERRMELMNLEKRIFQLMLSYLYESDFQWNMQKPDPRMRFPDMVIDIEHEEYSRWLIEFKAYPESSRGLGLPPHHIYGMIASTELNPRDKFTLVVNNEDAYDMFFRKPPRSLRANFYIMLVDIERGIVVKEEKLCSYYE